MQGSAGICRNTQGLGIWIETEDMGCTGSTLEERVQDSRSLGLGLRLSKSFGIVRSLEWALGTYIIVIGKLNPKP